MAYHKFPTFSIWDRHNKIKKKLVNMSHTGWKLGG